MNYGGIGFSIGHEISDAFSSRGNLYDKEGNFVKWWSSSTKEKYFAKAQSIIDQYSNYSIKEAGLNLNGIKSQEANIADNGGIKAAYLAYIDWSARNAQDEPLQGLNYTPRQMFWLSAASSMCTVYNPENLKELINNGWRTPAEFRILGPLSNMPEFARDFNCPMGSKMNPTKKNIVF